jgi:hypothetical protein
MNVVALGYSHGSGREMEQKVSSLQYMLVVIFRVEGKDLSEY